MKYIHSILFFFLSTFSLRAQSLVLATYQYADNNRVANIQPLAEYLSKKTGAKVAVKSYPSVHLFIQAIQKNEVDIALINTFGYLLLEAASKHYPMKPYAVLKVQEGAQDNYKTAIIAAQEYAIDTLSLVTKIAKDARLMLVSLGSTSGNLVPRLAFSSVGIKDPDKAFKSVQYGKNHKATLDSVLLAKADIGAIGSTEYFNFVKDSANARRIKLLWLSPEIPLGPVLLNNALSNSLKDSLVSFLLDLHTSNALVLESVKNGWSEAKQAERYISITHDYYEPFKRQLGDKKTMAEILKQFAN